MTSHIKQLKCTTTTFLIILIVGIGVNLVSCDYYTSVVGLEYLLDSESYLLETYENYLKQLQQTNQRIENFLEGVEESIQDIEEDPESYYSDPLNAFKIIKRIVVDWKIMEQTVLHDLGSKDFSTNFTRVASMGYANATLEDLVGASVGLARLQKTYALSAVDIADGILMDREYDTPLSAHDCFEIGRRLYDARNYNYSVEWLLQARMLLHFELEENKETYESDGNEEKVTVDFPHLSDVEILEFLAPSVFNRGNYKMAMVLNEELLAQEPNNKYGLENKALFETHMVAERSTLLELHMVQPQLPQPSEFDELTDAVCRGSVHQTPREQRPLRCRYVDNKVPFCLIAPLKMEELSSDPFVAIYHDSIYENEMQSIIKATEDQVERSKVGDASQSQFSEIRTSKNTWLYFDTNSFLKPIEQRLQDITGLNLDKAEPLQVVNYGIGGHYGAHYDFSEDPDATYPGQGNRILTALFYINEVELGGATAFPFLRLAVQPEKGSLVVWSNMHESLELDYRTRHVGCPVLKGSKWVCNEWFHQVGQEFRRPCSLERNGEISVPFKHIS